MSCDIPHWNTQGGIQQLGAPDWRIGLKVMPNFRKSRLRSNGDPIPAEQGVVLSAHPSGYGGIRDRDGVLRIEAESGNVFLDGANNWKGVRPRASTN